MFAPTAENGKRKLARRVPRASWQQQRRPHPSPKAFVPNGDRSRKSYAYFQEVRDWRNKIIPSVLSLCSRHLHREQYSRDTNQSYQVLRKKAKMLQFPPPCSTATLDERSALAASFPGQPDPQATQTWESQHAGRAGSRMYG